MILKGYIFSILYVLLCLAVALVVYKLGAPKHITRKVVHILVGFEWLILYKFMGAASPHFLAVCVLFLVLLALDYKLKLAPMMSSDGENAPGTVYYALAMSIMAFVALFVPNMIYPFGIAVFCTSFGDGLAGLVGQGIKKHNIKIWNEKTIFGALVNFAVSFAVPFVFSLITDFKMSWWQCLLVAAFALQMELFAERGLDNIFITLGVGFLSYCLVYVARIEEYLLPIMATPLVIALCLKKRALTPSAVATAIMLDVAVSLTFGNVGFLVLMAFFAGSMIADKIKKTRKKAEQSSETSSDKGHRGVTQVFANGFVAMLCALTYSVSEDKVYFIAFVAVMAEAFADTAASGIGSSAKRVYDVFRFEKCERGISGGMSLVGTCTSLVASFAVAAIPFIFGKLAVSDFLIIGFIGFAGAIFDSFLGSVFQAKYKCSVCGSVIEHPIHCEKSATRYRGVRVITNSVVNFLSTLFCAVIAILIFKIL